jgi:hypothetical protein
VLLPTAVVGIYLFAFAADQYVVEARFAIRGEVGPEVGLVAGEHPHDIQLFLGALQHRLALDVLLDDGIYLFAFAADQYVVEARFAIRGEVEPMGNVALGELTWTRLRQYFSSSSIGLSPE